MIVRIEQCAKFTVVNCEENRLDSICAPAFILYVKKNVGAERQAVILDLSLVEFMDSSGVGAIVSIFKSLNSKVSFFLCGAGENVKSLLDLTGISKLFETYPDKKTAEQALAS